MRPASLEDNYCKYSPLAASHISKLRWVGINETSEVHEKWSLQRGAIMISHPCRQVHVNIITKRDCGMIKSRLNFTITEQALTIASQFPPSLFIYLGTAAGVGNADS